MEYIHAGGALVKLIDDGTGSRFVHGEDEIVVRGIKMVPQVDMGDVPYDVADVVPDGLPDNVFWTFNIGFDNQNILVRKRIGQMLLQQVKFVDR